jgi:hypothetical protein
VLHGILVDWLELRHFTRKWGKWLESRHANQVQAIEAILEAIGAQGEVNALLYAEQHSSDWENVSKAIMKAVDFSKAAASRVWGNYVLCDEKNKAESPAPGALKRIDGCVVRHAPDHAHTEAIDYGGNINISAARMVLLLLTN